MHDGFRDRIDALHQRSLLLCAQAEQAEAYAADIQRLFAGAGVDNLAPPNILLGNVVHLQPYTPGFGPSDSGQAYQAAIAAPHGLGAVLWDIDHFLVQQASQEGLEIDAWALFIPFRECPRIVKARLLSEVNPLLDRLLRPI
jgi:hypothetical protein